MVSSGLPKHCGQPAQRRPKLSSWNIPILGKYLVAGSYNGIQYQKVGNWSRNWTSGPGGLETEEESNLRAIQVLLGKAKEEMKIRLIAKGQTEVRGQSNRVGLSLSSSQIPHFNGWHIHFCASVLSPICPPFFGMKNKFSVRWYSWQVGVGRQHLMGTFQKIIHFHKLFSNCTIHFRTEESFGNVFDHQKNFFWCFVFRMNKS